MQLFSTLTVWIQAFSFVDKATTAHWQYDLLFKKYFRQFKIRWSPESWFSMPSKFIAKFWRFGTIFESPKMYYIPFTRFFRFPCFIFKARNWSERVLSPTASTEETMPWSVVEQQGRRYSFFKFFFIFFKSDLFEQRWGSLTFKQFRCASWSRDWRQKPKFSSEMKSKLNPFSGGQFPFYYSNNPADFPFIIAV